MTQADDFLDFDLEITLDQGGEYLLRVDSPAGQARQALHFPFDEIALENRLLKLQNALLKSGGRRRQALTEEEQVVQDFGRDLFDCLLTGEARSRYDVCLERARAGGKAGLRLRLHIQPPELACLPWEYLYDSRRGEYLCLAADTPLVRYLNLAQPVPPLVVAPPLRILGLIADPSDLPRLDLEQERARLERALSDLQARGLVSLTWLPGQTWRDLQAALRRGPWHIFHFIGHGGFDDKRDEGFLVLCDEAGRSFPLRASDLGSLLAGSSSMRLALLNACEGAAASKRDVFSSTAAILARRSLPAVLAMQVAITDRAAIEFSRAFYESLADGRPVDLAATDGRQAVRIEVSHSLEWGAPVLYLRAAGSRLFAPVPAQPPPASGPSPLPPLAVSARPAPARPAAESARPIRVAVPPPPVETPPPLDEMTLELAPGLPLILRRVPAGEFLMGSDKQKDGSASDDELPQHPVYLDEYWIGQYPVTNAQYAAFVLAAQRRAPTGWKNARPPAGKADHPVVNVSWDDAAAFCRWASQAAGQPLALPTEAQWEKAARGLDGRIYPWGPAWEPGRCNCAEEKIHATTPVGRYSPQGDSPYGCCDLGGNVWEWCADWYDPVYYQEAARSAVRNPVGPPAGTGRVLRGGSWLRDRSYARCASRLWNVPVSFDDDAGFRLVRSPNRP